jgi:protein-disulfide isomerase
MQVVKESWRKGLLILAPLALLLAILALSGDNGTKAQRRAAAPAPSADPVRRTSSLLAGIPQHGAILGYRSAPVRLQFFADLQCVDSRRVILGALPFLIRRFVRAGKLQIRFRSTETDTKSAGGWHEFREQQTAALAAGEQNKLWSFIDLFYREQGPEFSGYATEDFLRQIAMQAGVDLERWSRDRLPFREDWPELREADESLAAAKQLGSTPTFLIGRTGGPARRLLHFSLQEPKVFEEALTGLL